MADQGAGAGVPACESFAPDPQDDEFCDVCGHPPLDHPSHRVRWFSDFDWRNRCTLQFGLSWYDAGTVGVALTYGLRGCDPVWMVSAEVNRPPRWLAWLTDKKEGVVGAR